MGLELSFSETEFLHEENMLESDAGNGCMTLWMHLVPLVWKFRPCIHYYDKNIHSVSWTQVHGQDGKGQTGNSVYFHTICNQSALLRFLPFLLTSETMIQQGTFKLMNTIFFFSFPLHVLVLCLHICLCTRCVPGA